MSIAYEPLQLSGRRVESEGIRNELLVPKALEVFLG